MHLLYCTISYLPQIKCDYMFHRLHLGIKNPVRSKHFFPQNQTQLEEPDQRNETLIIFSYGLEFDI